MSAEVSEEGPQPQFEVSTSAEDAGRRLRISLVGEVDHSNREELADALHDVSHRGIDEVVVDCSELTFIDSAGVGALVEAQDAAGATRIEVGDMSPPVERVLRAAKLT
jgi:anti-anti-sigma factor